MTITKNTDCTTITITDDLLDSFRTSSDDVTAVTLYYSVNGADEVTYEVEVADITADSMELDIAFFAQESETLCDGVYCFRMVVIQDTAEITKYGNILIDCGLICTLAEYIWNYPTKQLHSKYEAIKYYQQCNDCDCATVYSLYQDLLIDLDIDTNTDCGC